jgi:hypothetical protein
MEQKFNNPFCITCTLFMGTFSRLCVLLYGIPRGAEQDVARHVLHLCFVIRLQDLCFKNGGIYIKFG